jgi:hypothetical protein
VLNQILPQRLDNTYRGHPLALWLLVLMIVGLALSLRSRAAQPGERALTHGPEWYAR